MKLLTLLKSIQPDEYKDFEKFLQSPFFKASEQYLKFFKFLCKHHPSFELGKTDFQLAYQRCFKQQLPNDSKLYNLASGMARQVEQYFVVRMVLGSEDNDDRLYNQLLVKSLGLRNMGLYFRTEAQRVIDQIDEQSIKEIDDYLVLHRLHQQVYYNPDTPKLVEYPPHLQLAVDHLDLYYVIAKLRYVAEMKARERILNVRYELPFLEEVLAHTASLKTSDGQSLLAVYHALVSLYMQGVDDSGFRALLTLFTDKFPQLPKPDQAVLIRHLINCGISLITRDAAVEPELLALYKLAIDSEMLLDGTRITDSSFINISNLAALCKEYEWAETFIQQFSPYLEESKQEAAIGLAKAGLYYYQGKLDEAQECLNSAIFPISAFDILSRGLLLKIAFDRYLEQDKNYDFLMAQLHAFERFVQMKPWAPEKKTAQLNYIRFVQKMSSLKFELVKVPELNKAALRKKLKQLQPIISKKWLKEKIEAL